MGERTNSAAEKPQKEVQQEPELYVPESPSDHQFAEPSNPIKTPPVGGILRLANRGDPPAGFDTMRSSSIAIHQIGGAIFGPGNLVMRCREDMYAVCPYIAESWIHNPGFTVWTFTIRDDVFWHDGVRFTAEDAKFWFDLVFFGARVGDKVRAPAYFEGELGKIETIEVLSEDRIRLTFAEKNQHLLSLLANPRLKMAHPRHLMQSRLYQGEMSISPLDVGLVGLGPFRFHKYDPGIAVQVRRFDRYWEKDSSGNPLPYLEGIDYMIIEEPFSMDIAFRTGRLDGGARGQAHHLTTERKKGYVRDLGDQVFYTEIDGGTLRLAFNVLKAGPWQDSRVRRAIALWIDKQAAIPAALGGFGWTSPNLGPPNLLVPRHFINWPKFDLGSIQDRRTEAKHLLNEAGYKNGFSMGHLCRAVNQAPCEFLKDQLLGLNIDLQLHVVDEGKWNRARVSLAYDSQQGRLTTALIPEGTESVYGRYTKNPDSYAKHEDPKVDELYRNLRNATTFAQRVQRWRQLEHYLFVEATYVIPIAESTNVIPYRSYVHGLVLPPEDKHAYTDFATVWLAQ